MGMGSCNFHIHHLPLESHVACCGLEVTTQKEFYVGTCDTAAKDAGSSLTVAFMCFGGAGEVQAHW
jgi:hypothetical protein